MLAVARCSAGRPGAMEIELKFQVPAPRRAALQRAVAATTARRTRLQAIYADTADDRLAAAGLALRLRKEGRLWVQTLKGRGDGLMQRLEHELPLPPLPRGTKQPLLDPRLHVGTPAGDRLLPLLADGAALLPLYRTDIWRTHRELRQGGACIEIAFDEGFIEAGGHKLPVCEIEFELVSGPPQALVALARRWVARHGLWWDVRTKSERGFRLARDLPQVPAVRAAPASLSKRADTAQAWREMLQQALAQALPNLAEMAGGSGTPEHLHQLRVGLRRLRTVLALCADWAPDAEAAKALQQAWREPFSRLGAARDADVLAGALWAELQAAGAPARPAPLAAADFSTDSDDPVDHVEGPPEPGAIAREPGVTDLLLQSLAQTLAPQAPSAVPAEAMEGAAAETDPHQVRTGRPGRPLKPSAVKVLQAAWRKLKPALRQLQHLDVEDQHRTRRHLKRLRYVFEALLPLWDGARGGRDLRRWHRRLRNAVDALGRYNDLCVAQQHLADSPQASADAAPAMWFALGWLAAERPRALARAARQLRRLADTSRPWGKR